MIDLAPDIVRAFAALTGRERREDLIDSLAARRGVNRETGPRFKHVGHVRIPVLLCGRFRGDRGVKSSSLWRLPICLDYVRIAALRTKWGMRGIFDADTHTRITMDGE